MGNTKRELSLWSFYDHTGMQRHLEKMAAKGWMLEKIHTNGLWRYRRIEPRRLHFAVTYFPSASDFDAAPGADQQEFYDICAAAGWQFVAQTFQMQIFCNEQEDPVPLDADPKVQVENIHEAMWRSYIWGNFLVLGIGAVCLFAAGNLLTTSPIRALSRYLTLYAFAMGAALTLRQGGELACYFLWQRKAARLVQEEERFLAVRSPGPVWKGLFLVLDALLLIPFFLGDKWPTGLAIVLFAAAVFLCQRLGCFFRDSMKGRGLPAGVNRVFTLLLISFLISGIQGVRASNAPWIADWTHEMVQYVYKTRTCTAYRDDLPLTMGTLRGEDDALYSNRLYQAQTPLASITSGYQLRREDASRTLPRQFYYHLYRSDLDFALEDALEWVGCDVLTTRYADPLKETQAVDPAPFGAEAAWYRRHSTSYQYLLRYENCVVQLYFDWEPTQPQLQTTLDILLAL